MSKLTLAVVMSLSLGALGGFAAGRALSDRAYTEHVTPSEDCRGVNAYAGSDVTLDHVFFCTEDGKLHLLRRAR